MQSTVSVIIVNYNGWRDTVECVESLLKSNYKEFNIIIVDNSPDNSSFNNFKLWAEGKLCIYLGLDNPLKDKVYPLVKKNISYSLYGYSNSMFSKIGGDKESKICFIRSDKNSGYTGGNNIGLCFNKEFIKSKYVWFLNNDTVVSDNTLSNQIKFAESNLGIIGSLVLFYFDPTRIQAFGGTKKFNFFPVNKNSYVYGNLKVNEADLSKPHIITGYVYGASMLVPMSIIDKIGFFDEKYFMWYDEFDFCYRAKLAGYKFYALNDSCVWHKEGGATRDYNPLKKNTETLKRFVVYGYYGTRNCLYLNRKYNNVFKYYMYTVPILLFFLVKGCLRVFIKFKKERARRIEYLLLGFRDGVRENMGMTVDISAIK